jgi:segregation and condensation protein B
MKRMDTAHVKHVIEATLLSNMETATVSDLRRLFADEVGADTIKTCLEDLQKDWSDRGVQLVALASGWRFQTAPMMAQYLERLHPDKPQRYSRATMETLAIIAYRQPVTRGDIEEIRGVTVSSHVVKSLEDRGWIEVIGQKDVIGRPSLFGTTKQFLDDLSLSSLQDLPAIQADGPEHIEGLISDATPFVEKIENALQISGAPDLEETATAPELNPEPDNPLELMSELLSDTPESTQQETNGSTPRTT